MNAKLELMLEAERRGILPNDKKAALAEARRRGLVGAAPVPMDEPYKPAEPEYAHVDQSAMIARDLSNMGQGALYGVGSVGVGIGQALARPPQLAPFEAIAGQFGYESPLQPIQQTVDDYAKQRAQSFEQSAAGQSFPGKVGEFAGGVVATAPLSALAIPARGAGILSSLSRSALAGGTAAGVMPATGNGSFAEQKSRQIALGAGTGGGLTMLGRGGMAAAELFGWSPNALAQVSNLASGRANAKPFAVEGEQLAARTGVRLTPGKVSGGRVQTALENMSRQSIFSADIAAEADQKIAGDAIGYINRLMGNLSKSPADASTLGVKIQQVAAGSVKRITDRREAVTGPIYAAVDKHLAGRAFVTYGKTQKVLADIVSEFEGVGTPEAARILSQARKLAESMGNPQTLKQFQNQRSYYGRASQGKGTVFDDVDRTINQRMAKRIYGALSDDLDAATARLEGGRGHGLVPAGQLGLAGALKKANDEYRKFSQLAEAVKDHPIARLFGKDVKADGAEWFNSLPPEKVIARLRDMQPTEIGMVRRYVEGTDPAAWQQYKRLIVQDALEKAQTLPANYGKTHVPFSAATFLTVMGGTKPAEISKLKEAFSAAELKEIDDAFSIARRLGDRFGSNPSGTGPYNEVVGFMASLRKRSTEALASTAGEAFGLRKIANVMLNADGRRALIELSRLPPRSKQAVSVMSQLAAIMAGQNTSNPVEQKNKGP